MARPIGIDLGTTYTVVATLEAGRPRFLANAHGEELIPSVVAFTEDGVLVGQRARAQAAANPERTVFSIKRRMGTDFTMRSAGREYTPEDISGLILHQVKADAEERLGEPVSQAVVTVPAYFNDRQRQATKEAARLAGLEVLRIINEPTAAALAYGLEREEAHTILVWDLGGGTFDVSILELGEGIFQVRAVSGDNCLGGDDFDGRVAEYLAEEYGRLTGADFPPDLGARQRLREAAERAKIELSSSPVARVRLPVGESEPGRLEVELTQERLESLVADLLQRMVAPTRQALADARLSPGEVDRVILAGGATRMPAVRRLVRELLGKEPYRYVDPDRVVAAGAAIHAGMLLGLVDKAVLLDVLPLSLGVETQGGLMARIIPRNTPLPTSEAQVFTNAADGQASMEIHVLQGERELAIDNVSLGRFQLQGIPPAPRGVVKVEVSLEADVDGIVHLSAKEFLTGSEVKVKVAAAKQLDRDEIQRLALEAQLHAVEDRERRESIGARMEAEGCIAAAEGASNELAGAPAQQLRLAISRLKEAMDPPAAGAAEGIRGRIGELRRLLAASSTERPGA